MRKKKKIRGFGGTIAVFDDPVKTKDLVFDVGMLMDEVFGEETPNAMFQSRDRSRSVATRASQVPLLVQHMTQVLKDVEFLMQRADAEDAEEC